VLEGAAALLEHRFAHAKVTLTIDAPASVPAISGDPGQLEQVLVNLLMNAVDACAPGGHVVARAASAESGGVLLTISDDGCGIPREQLGAVLDPFFTTKKRGQGTGLGLTIAADIARNHGGALAIESEVGRGTTVRVTLPAAPITPAKGQPT
jgi:signal transduction histidine kinase